MILLFQHFSSHIVHISDGRRPFASNRMEAVLKDERFARIAKDKKFRGVSKKQRKVEIDQRFQSMFKDANFVSKCSVDKRGRPTSFSSKENFKKYYALRDSDEEESHSDDEEDSEAEAEAEAESEPELVSRVGEEEAVSSADESIEATVKVSAVYPCVGCWIDSCPLSNRITLLPATLPF